MKKRFLVLMLVLAMALCAFVACGGEEEAPEALTASNEDWVIMLALDEILFVADLRRIADLADKFEDDDDGDPEAASSDSG